ncbi:MULTISPECIES: hypothetical protein [Lactococcus]|nr:MULTISPECIES: hypothetical protein [Lactococcus]
MIKIKIIISAPWSAVTPVFSKNYINKSILKSKQSLDPLFLIH